MLGLFHVRDLVQSREFAADLTDYSKKKKKEKIKERQKKKTPHYSLFFPKVGQILWRK